MGDIYENFDPPIRDLGSHLPRARSTRPLLDQTSSGLTSREEALRRAIARDQAELAALERETEARRSRFGEEPPVGSVITFQRSFATYPGKVYSYAALRVGSERVADSGWYLTGRDAKRPRTWESLCEFIGDVPFRVIPPEATPVLTVTEDEAVAAFGGDATSRRLATLRPFIVGREPNGGRWQVIDERLDGQLDAVTGERLDVVRTYPANDKGRTRARQSVDNRNARYRAEVRRLEVEPPVGSRVRSTFNPQIWARRQSDGWVRYFGDQIQAVRLTWSTVRAVLNRLPGGLEPGTPTSPHLIEATGDARL